MKKYDVVLTNRFEYVFHNGICKEKINMHNENYHGANFNYTYDKETKKTTNELSFYWDDKLLK